MCVAYVYCLVVVVVSLAGRGSVWWRELLQYHLHGVRGVECDLGTGICGMYIYIVYSLLCWGVILLFIYRVLSLYQWQSRDYCRLPDSCLMAQCVLYVGFAEPVQ